MLKDYTKLRRIDLKEVEEDKDKDLGKDSILGKFSIDFSEVNLS